MKALFSTSIQHKISDANFIQHNTNLKMSTTCLFVIGKLLNAVHASARISALRDPSNDPNRVTLSVPNDIKMPENNNTMFQFHRLALLLLIQLLLISSFPIFFQITEENLS